LDLGLRLGNWSFSFVVLKLLVSISWFVDGVRLASGRIIAV